MTAIARIPWVTTATAGAALVASVVPGLDRALEYDRVAALSGEPWRVLTAQLVHWTPRMTCFDLGVLLAVGVWIERCSRGLSIATLAAGALAVACVLVASAELQRYRGSSGLASSLLAAAAVFLVRSRSGWPRGLALGAIAALAVKVGVETATGTAIFAGALPQGVRVLPAVHGAAALTGALVAIAYPLQTCWRRPIRVRGPWKTGLRPQRGRTPRTNPRASHVRRATWRIARELPGLAPALQPTAAGLDTGMVSPIEPSKSSIERLQQGRDHGKAETDSEECAGQSR